MNMIEKDIEVLNSFYKEYLFNLKKFLQENSLTDIQTSFNVLNYLLRNAKFSYRNEIIFDDKYDYFPLPKELSDAIEVMHGICCCRHVNTLNYDIFKLLGFDVKIQPMLIKGDTRIELNSYVGGNHIAVTSYDGIQKYTFDLIGGFKYINDNGVPYFLDTSLNSETKKVCETYEDKENIEGISKILKKYYTLRELGVERIYD